MRFFRESDTNEIGLLKVGLCTTNELLKFSPPRDTWDEVCRPNRADPGLLKTCLSDDDMIQKPVKNTIWLFLDQLLNRKILDKSASRGEGIGAAHDKKVTSSLALSVL